MRHGAGFPIPRSTRKTANLRRRFASTARGRAAFTVASMKTRLGALDDSRNWLVRE
jgi:hypothetical protein